MAIFKSIRDPFYKELLTNDNTIYCCSITGSDNNPGTREAPVQTIQRALKIENKNFVCVNDGIYDAGSGYPHANHKVLFADKNFCTIIGTYVAHESCVYNFHIDKIYGTTPDNDTTPGFNNCCIYEFEHYKKGIVMSSRYNYIENFIARGISYTYLENFTIKNFKNYLLRAYEDGILLNHIFINEIDLYKYTNQSIEIYPKFKYCLFRKSLKWSWNGNIIPITYSEDKENWINDLKSSLQDYAEKNLQEDDSKYLTNIANKSFLENNLIHDDIEDTPIFNKYDKENNPVDLSLYLDKNNPALHMSSHNSFVGAFPPSVRINMKEIINVDNDGCDDYNEPGNLLIYNDSDGSYEGDKSSNQIWNSTRSNIITPELCCFDFSGIQGFLETGLNTRLYFGKKQIYDANNIPVETIEVIPYDDENTLSVFPRFSCSLSENTQIWYHKSGNKSGMPVLFNDLADIGILSNVDLKIYGNYAVTTADYNSNDLELSGNYIAKKISIRYFRLELNLHFAN
ncbi:MAG: DUF1565 domain-containing protein [Bacteroidales bacterium]|jgi:hypothetical protein|nr:DUF1565 domain-containing protein [Bacteroidales bacterium]